MKIKLTLYSMLLAVTISGAAYGQGCESLLKYGLYNTAEKRSNSTEYVMKLNNFCSVYSRERYTERSVSASAEVFGLLGASGGYTESDLERLYNMNCGQSVDIKDIKSNSFSYEKFIDKNILDSYVKCRELEGKHVFFELMPTDEKFKIFTIKIGDRNPAKDNIASINRITYGPANIFVKEPPLITKPVKLTEIFSFQLERKLNPTAQVMAPLSQVSIMLNSEVFTINLPQIDKEKDNKPTWGLGQVMSSLLDTVSFYSLHNTSGYKWVLADGRNVHGSQYQILSRKANVPDLRGMFLRGKNYKRNDGNRNPEGDKGLGELQNYATALPTSTGFTTTTAGNHTHTITANKGLQMPGEDYKDYDQIMRGDNGVPIALGLSASEAGNHAHGIEGGDKETRPKNVTVNFFICIQTKR